MSHGRSGKINKDRSEFEPFGINENMQKEERRLTKYEEANFPPQEAKWPSETTPLRDNSAFEEYQMEKEKDKRGWCLIINNTDYKNHAPYRGGSDKDKDRLQEVFDRLKFIIDPQDNMHGGAMHSILKEYADKDHTDMDCFVCCILSHGNKDEVICCDKDCVSIETITRYFRASCCPSLAGKPKLFFFQACQGSDHMGGVQVDGSNVSNKKRTLKEGSLPDEADFLLGFATSSGFVSYRYVDTGSTYIQTLCNLLEEYTPKYDLLTIMTEVHRKIAEEIFITKENGTTKQMPTTIHRLRKQLYFNM